MRRAFAEVALLGVTGGAVGCWVVLRELSYGAESLPHAMFPGLVLAALAGAPLLVGGAAGLALAAVAVALAARDPRVGGDTGVAVVVTTLFGLGALLALSPRTPTGVQSLLFGDLLGTSKSDVAAAAVLALVALAALRVLHDRLLIAGFDRTTAATLGVSATVADGAILLLLALSVLVAVQAMGNLLVVALLVAPAASARLLVHRMLPMMATASAIAVACGAGGLYASYYLDTAAGASIAAVMVIVFGLATATQAITE